MSHPCDGHACDHCYLCDVVGICCATVPAGVTASTVCSCNDGSRLREAVVDEAAAGVGLGQLIRLETAIAVEPSREPAVLPPGPAAFGLTTQSSQREEEARVAAPRHHQS